MDETANLNELKERVKRFCDERDWDQFHDAKELSVGLSIEASELLEHFRWKNKEEVNNLLKDPNKKEEIQEEMADVFYYLLRISQLYNIDLSDAFHKKMDKNETKYSVEKAKGSNKKYNEY